MDEAEIYVRDHLLIQWMLEFLNFDTRRIEDIYAMWRDWIKEMEENNDKRSEV